MLTRNSSSMTWARPRTARCSFDGGEPVGACLRQSDPKGCTYYAVAMGVDDLVPRQSAAFRTRLRRWTEGGGFTMFENTVKYYNRQVAEPLGLGHTLAVSAAETLPRAIGANEFYVLGFSSDIIDGSHVVYLQRVEGAFLVVCDPWCGKKMRLPRDAVRGWSNLDVYRVVLQAARCPDGMARGRSSGLCQGQHKRLTYKTPTRRSRSGSRKRPRSARGTSTSPSPSARARRKRPRSR